MYRNHEYYIDQTAGEAIRRADRSVTKKLHRLWGDRLTYRIGEVIEMKLIVIC